MTCRLATKLKGATMDWITLQENYFLLFLTLTGLGFGGFLVGTLLGYGWIHIQQFGWAFTNQTHTAYSKMHSHVIERPRRQRTMVVARSMVNTQKRLVGQSMWQKSHGYA